MTLKFEEWPWKTIGHLFNATSSFLHHFGAIGEFKMELQSGNDQSGSNSTIFEPCDLEIWRMTLKNNRAPLQCYFNLCASFCSHWCIQTWVRVLKTANLGQIRRFFEPCDLKFDGWPWKTIGHFCIATSSFVHHFLAVGEFKLDLQSGNAESGSNSTNFRAVWPWNSTDDLEKQ